MGQNFNKNTYHATGQAAYLDLEQAKNNFDALASSFCGPQDPAALGFSEPGMLWLNNSTGILSQRNESNSSWVTLFDLRNQRIATGRVTAASISNSARKPSLITGQAISPGSCSIQTAFEATLSDLRAGYNNGDLTLRSVSGTYLVSNSSWTSMIGIRLGRWGGTIRMAYTITRTNASYNTAQFQLRRNGTAFGSVLTIPDNQASGMSEQVISGNSPHDFIQVYGIEGWASQNVSVNLRFYVDKMDNPQ